ncbi:MAG: hypothetical protein JNK82_00275 [Myxococcaceae bacterium]|nr:hypothetical protein [Myxococcaceae bacterium]
MRHALLSLCLVAAACSKPTPPADKPADLTPVDMGNHPPIVNLPDPDLQGGHVGRAPRRITVAQLKQSILITTGRQWSEIDNLAPSLGRADYALVNAEAIEPNLVFAKFLEDGARQVCLGAAQADLSRPVAADRVLSPLVGTATDLTTLVDDDVKKNLVYLSTRFWGQPLAGAELDTWATTFKGLAQATKTPVPPATVAAPRHHAWGGICVALMTDPRFFTY